MAKNLTLIFLFIGEMEAYQFLLCIYLKVETITFKVFFHEISQVPADML